MDKAKVYFTNLRTTPEQTILQKLEMLMEKAGIKTISFKKQYVAIKLHLGEPGNLAYLRPNYSRVVADLVRKLGGKPFLTDSNTLYVGRRKDALEHLDAAYENGYNPFCTGCQVIIADGLKGSDEVLVPVSGGEYIKEAKIGRAIMDADIVISLTHFKGHELTGFGGAVKNIGMGSGSRGGKMEMHSKGKPKISTRKCMACGRCIKNCAQDAISLGNNGKAVVDRSRCVGCGRCLSLCPFDAILFASSESNEILCKKMAEYAKAVLEGRPHFHVSFVVDVSPFCDCHVENDLPIVPDIGIFASFDPVAIDQACADAVRKAPVIAGSFLAEKTPVGHGEDDYFHVMHPDTHWQTTLEHCEKIGIGTRIYELIEV
ncbi:MAG: DUF362 domain-containing protein [Synergistaceae bacterium]|nr:DUF362 domain-containing protein [Synergistaceae bacterium]